MTESCALPTISTLANTHERQRKLRHGYTSGYTIIRFNRLDCVATPGDRKTTLPAMTGDSAEVRAQWLPAQAEVLAAEAHKGKLDKAGLPYIGHPRRLVGYLVNPTAEETVVAWLHDVVEDTGVINIALEYIKEAFGPQISPPSTPSDGRRDRRSIRSAQQIVNDHLVTVRFSESFTSR